MVAGRGVGAAGSELTRGASGVVDEEQRDPVVVVVIAQGDELLIAGVVNQLDRRGVRDVDESCWAAAVLDVGPARRGDGGEEEGVGGADGPVVWSTLEFLRASPMSSPSAIWSPSQWMLPVLRWRYALAPENTMAP